MSAATDATLIKNRVIQAEAATKPVLTKAQLAAALAHATVTALSTEAQAEIVQLIRRGRIVVTDR